MNKPSFLTEPFGRRSLSVVLALILLPIITVSQVALSQENAGADRQEAIRRIVQTYMQTGQEEYKKGFFEQAVKTFFMAQEYEEYLTVATRERLKELLKESQIAVLERKGALETFRVVNDLIKRDQLIAAKTYLEKIKDSKFLTTEERKQIAEAFRQIDAQVIVAKAKLEKSKSKKPSIKEKPVEAAAEVKKPVVSLDERKKEIAELWNRSIGLYYTGQLEKAREGFVKVAASDLIPPQMRKAVEGYLAQIDKLLPNRAERKLVREQEKLEAVVSPVVTETEVTESDVAEVEVAETEVLEPKVAESEVVTTKVAPRVVSPVTGQSTYIEKINRERKIIRDYTRVVVNDAIAKARSYINQARFDRAKNAVETAALTVNQNQMHLGDALFKEYSGKLKAMTEEILEKENAKILEQEQQKRQLAAEAQRRFRTQMEIDRKERIAELMENALTYQKQQRYEAALGQLVSLLALDPQNEQALVLKDTLEDMIYFRKQLEVKKESEKQRADILLKTDESGITYAEELTYPPYWRELIEKPTRQPDRPIGLSEVDKFVYDQLEELIDLSDLTPVMTFGEVIEKLRNSVEGSVQIQPNWKDLLENAEVDQDTTAGMDPLTSIKLRKALEILLAGVSSIDFAELIYVVDEGVILIGTVDMLERPMVHRVYDISDLVAEPANFRGMGGGMMGGGMYDYEREYRADNLITLIQDTVDPDSWWEAGGEGTITTYENKKLIILQSRDIHNEIETLLNEMRKALGHQVSIETRFLVVTENFLEDIGLDIDFTYNFGGKWSPIVFDQGSLGAVVPEVTKVPGTLAGIEHGLTVGGGGLSGYATYGSALDDLQVSFLIRATQAHTDATTLTAPKLTVLSGESATFQIQRDISYALPPTVLGGGGAGALGGGYGPTYGAGAPSVIQNVQRIPAGTSLTITPTISPDKKYVLLNITTYLQDLLRLKAHTVEAVIPGTGGAPTTRETYRIEVPETEMSSLQTRVSVPDGGTLLLGGQKITAEVEKEAGVPVLSKIPFIGRLFSNRTIVKDHKILLILVKPTIILQEEREKEAIAAMESGT